MLISSITVVCSARFEMYIIQEVSVEAMNGVVENRRRDSILLYIIKGEA